jgi:1-acyl-sn-glycerol-3-phosphate acyltransferase
MCLLHKFTLQSFIRVILGGEYSNTNNLKGLDQFVIVANHNSHVDTAAILSALPIRHAHKVHAVAAKDYFAKNKVSEIVFRLFMNILIIDRKTSEGKSQAISIMEQAIDDGKSLIIFPEGSRSTDSSIKKFKTGIVKLLRSKPKLAIVPIYFHSSGQVQPKGDPMLVPHNFKMIIGKPFHLPNDERDDQNCAEFIRGKVLELQQTTV